MSYKKGACAWIEKKELLIADWLAVCAAKTPLVLVAGMKAAKIKTGVSHSNVVRKKD
jgi:hypothetical protein